MGDDVSATLVQIREVRVFLPDGDGYTALTLDQARELYLQLGEAIGSTT